MTQRSVEIETGDGTCPAALSIPDGEGPWPAVIMFADAGGMRDTIRQMGERLSGLGYVVLVPDFYYRNGPYEPVDMRTAFENKETMERIMGMMRGYTADMWSATPRPSSTTWTRCPRRSQAASGPPATAWAVGCRSSPPRIWASGSRHPPLPRGEHRQGRRPRQPPPQSGRHQGHRLRGRGDRGPVVPRRAEGPPREGSDRGRSRPHDRDIPRPPRLRRPRQRQLRRSRRRAPLAGHGEPLRGLLTRSPLLVIV
jgi:hypothetical protein